MIKTIVVQSSEVEIVRCPQWDAMHGSECWGLKPKHENVYYCVGSKELCQESLDDFKKGEM